MRKVIFPISSTNGLRVYPDAIELFANTVDVGTNCIADYSGADTTILDAPPEFITLTLTSISSDDANEVLNGQYEITCAINSTLTFDVTADVAINDTFRIPFTNGSETSYALIKFVAGVATVSTQITKSGLWQITENAVNAGLGDAYTKFKLNTVKAYIVQ